MSDNPLRQYFRRPAIYIKLPSEGKYYDSSVVNMPHNQDLAVYPMTAIDEITTKTPDAVFNGQAVVDIIHSCIPNVKNAWEINNIDLETLLVSIKIASGGEQLDISSKCPKCEEESDYSVNLLNMLNSKSIPNYDKELLVNDLRIKFRPLTYRETNKNNLSQYEIQKVVIMLENYEDTEAKQREIKESLDKLNMLMTSIIADTIESITTPETTVTDKSFIREFLDNCDKNTNKMIKEESIRLKNESQMKPISIKCPHCQNEYQQQLLLNISDFFD